MRYIKPAILSTFMASKSIMGIPKSNMNVDNVQGGTPAFLSSAAAYEADE